MPALHQFLKAAAGGALSLLAVSLAAGGVSAQETVRFGVAGLSATHSPSLVAAVKPEIYAAHGVALEITDFRGQSANCIAALLSEAIDICQVGTTTGTDAIAEGAELKAVAVLSGPLSEIILSETAAAATGATMESSVQDRIRALKGLRIVTAAPGSAHYTTLANMLKNVGLDIADLQYRTLGDTVAMVEGIRNGQIDGAMWTAGILGGLVADGAGLRWISIPRGDIPEARDIPFVTLYARAKWIEEHPDLAEHVHAGVADAIAWIKAETAQASELVKAKYFPDLAPAIWNDGFEQAASAYFDGAVATRAGWERGLELQAATGKNYERASFDNVVLPFAQAK